MIKILRMFGIDQYDYSEKNKTLYIYEPITVKTLRTLQNTLKDKKIVVLEKGSKYKNL